MKKSILLLFIAFVFGSTVYAQQVTATLDIGNFAAPIRSDGQLFQNSNFTLGGLEWPKTAVPGDKRYISYTGQIWMSGHDQQGTLRVAANEYGQTGECYFPGRAGFPNASWNNVWKISRAEIDQFRADFASGNVNFANYPVIQSWPAYGTTTLGAVKPCALRERGQQSCRLQSERRRLPRCAGRPSPLLWIHRQSHHPSAKIRQQSRL